MGQLFFTEKEDYGGPNILSVVPVVVDRVFSR